MTHYVHKLCNKYPKYIQGLAYRGVYPCTFVKDLGTYHMHA